MPFLNQLMLWGTLLVLATQQPLQAQGGFVSSTHAPVLFSKPTEADSTLNRPMAITYLDRTTVKVDSQSLMPLATGARLTALGKDSLQVMAYVDSLAALRVVKLRANEQEASMTYSAREALLNRLRDVPSILPLYLSADQTGLVKTRLSSPFGMRQHPISGSLVTHAGIDLPAAMGTVVYATADGYVRQLINQSDGIGLAIYLSHRRGHQTLYGHLLTTRVKPGDFVVRGQAIGRVGLSGLTTGPHLHYGIRYNGDVVDPLPYCFLLAKSAHAIVASKNE